MTDHPQTELLSAYLDAELPDAERSDLERHLESCAECTSTLGVLRTTLADLSSLPEIEMSDAQIARLDAAVSRARTEASRTRRTRFMRLAWAGGGVAASIIAVAVFASSLTGRNVTTTAVHGPTGTVAGGNAGSVENDYTEATARGALLAFAGIRGDTEVGFAAGGSNADSSGAPLSREAPAQPQSYLYSSAEARRCDAAVRSGATESVSLIRTDFATFKGQPATLLFYVVPANEPKRAELWIVRPSDCYTLFFAQTPLKR